MDLGVLLGLVASFSILRALVGESLLRGSVILSLIGADLVIISSSVTVLKMLHNSSILVLNLLSGRKIN